MKPLTVLIASTLLHLSVASAAPICGTLEKINVDFSAQTAQVILTGKNPFTFENNDGQFQFQIQFLSGHLGRTVCMHPPNGIELKQ